MNKYLVISPYPPPFIGGHLVYVATIIDNCCESFDILTNALPEGEFERISEKDNPIRKKWIRSMFKQPTLVEYIITYPYLLLWIFFKRLTHKYDAILVNWAPAPNSLIHILGRVIGVPTIGILHGEEIPITLRESGVKGSIKRFLMKIGYKKADGFIAACHFIREQAIKLGINPAIIDVIPVCFNPRNLKLERKRKVTGHNIISVGTTVERKGFHLLVDAVHELRKVIPDVKLNIVGDGPFMPIVKKRIELYGLHNHVFLHGHLPDDQLSELYEQNNLFVLANHMLDDGNTEGGSLVVCDASSHGLPVIGGTGGGLSTTIIDGETGFIVNSRDVVQLAEKIKLILTTPELAERMGKAGREKIIRDHSPKKLGQLLGKSISRFAQVATT